MTSDYKCYFDGCCEPSNPDGMMGIGVYIQSVDKEFETGYKIEAKKGNTNNIAEYLAFIKIMELMKNKVNCDIEIFGDSMMVVKQMNGEWNVNSGAYAKYALIASTMLIELKKNNKVTISWIKRDFNSKADEQSRKSINYIKGKY